MELLSILALIISIPGCILAVIELTHHYQETS